MDCVLYFVCMDCVLYFVYGLCSLFCLYRLCSLFCLWIVFGLFDIVVKEYDYLKDVVFGLWNGVSLKHNTTNVLTYFILIFKILFFKSYFGLTKVCLDWQNSEGYQTKWLTQDFFFSRTLPILWWIRSRHQYKTILKKCCLKIWHLRFLPCGF